MMDPGALALEELDAASLLRVFVEAAGGRVPVRDLDAAMDPSSWAVAVARSLAATPASQRLAEAVAGLLGSPRLPEVELGRLIQTATKVAAPEVLWPLLARHLAAASEPAAEAVAMALTSTFGAATPSIAELGYALATAEATPDTVRARLLRLIGRADPAWLVAHPTWLIAGDPEVARARITDALGGLDSARMASTFAQLEVVAVERGRPLAPVVGETVAAMVAARVRAGR